MKLRFQMLYILLLPSILLMEFQFPWNPTKQMEPALANQPAQQANYTVYLPQTMRGFQSQNVMGVAIDNPESEELDRVASLGASWIRRDLSWRDVEPTPGARNWEALSSYENTLRRSTARDIRMIAVIEATPAWALKPGFKCGAVAQEHLQKLGDFLYDTVKRYSASPYYVKYWELWNEPEAVDFLGCWGQVGDPHFGGEYYAEMLKVAYPRIKEADPEAQVLLGGLLLDCDPRDPPVNAQNEAKDCSSAQFFEGILRNGGGNYFNGVSFHAYDYYVGANHYANPNWHSDQFTTGPVMVQKANYLQGLLKAAGFNNKFLINTEMALFCDNCNSIEHQRAKNNYILQAYASALANNFRASIWWNAMGHRSSGLLNPDFTPQPAYYAYQFTRQKLGPARFVRTLTQPGITGYEFQADSKTIWVLWSTNGSSVQVTLQNPKAVLRIGDDGRPVDAGTSNSINVGAEALLIEF